MTPARESSIIFNFNDFIVYAVFLQCICVPVSPCLRVCVCVCEFVKEQWSLDVASAKATIAHTVGTLSKFHKCTSCALPLWQPSGPSDRLKAHSFNVWRCERTINAFTSHSQRPFFFFWFLFEAACSEQQQTTPKMDWWPRMKLPCTIFSLRLFKFVNWILIGF